MLSNRQFHALRWVALKVAMLSSWLTLLTMREGRVRAFELKKRELRKAMSKSLH